MEKEEKTLVILGTKPLRNTEIRYNERKMLGVTYMAKDFFGRLEETIQTTGKAAAQKAKEVADSAKRHNDLRVAKRDLNDLYRQVGEKYFEEHMDYPQAEYIDLFNLIEKLRGDIEILKQEIDGGDDEAAEEDIEDIEE